MSGVSPLLLLPFHRCVLLVELNCFAGLKLSHGFRKRTAILLNSMPLFQSDVTAVAKDPLPSL